MTLRFKKLLTSLVAGSLIVAMASCTQKADTVSDSQPDMTIGPASTRVLFEKTGSHAPRVVVSKKGMVAAAHPLAAEAGLEMLKKGGNAIDAALATGFALNVVESLASGIGGGGFILLHTKDGKDIAIDFRGMAPAYVNKTYKRSYLQKGNPARVSHAAVAVPGMLAGYEEVLNKYGSLPMSEIVKPAIRLAEQGFPMTTFLTKYSAESYEHFLNNNDPENVPYLIDGLLVEEGELIRRPKLAKAFRLIGEKGARGAFYEGPIGKSMVKRLNELGSPITMDDFKAYKVAVRTPIKGVYRGYQIISMPPTSSGGIAVVETLNIMENFPVRSWEHSSVKHIHHLQEAFKVAFIDRKKFVADPDFHSIPIKMMTSKEYARERSENIRADKAKKVKPGKPSDEHWSTTHFSVADAEGNIVAVTQTLVHFFGSAIFDPVYGFNYNDELTSFSSDPRSVNAPEPGKRGLSSMTPTMVLDKEGKAFMTLGSPGSSRIINAVTQIISNVIDFDMNIDEAIEAPRQSGTWDKTLYLEGHIPDVASKVDILAKMGHKIKLKDRYDLYFGGAQAIMFKNGKLYGAADSRRDGVAVGF